jgi:CHASE2 domain-containing sensor protein
MARFVQQFWKKSEKWRTENARVLLTAGSVSSVVFLLRFFSLLQFAELAAFDALVNLRPPEPQDDRIRVITVDQKDLNKYNWPLEDYLLAELLQKIDAQHPSVVGLDIIRDRPIGRGAEIFQSQISAMPNFIGIEALHTNPEFYTSPLAVMRKPDKNGKLKKGVGFNNVQLDTDGMVRRSLLFWKFEGDTRRSLSLQLAEYYLKEQKGISSEGYPTDNPKYLKLGPAVFYDLRDFHSLYGFLDREKSNYQIISNLSNPDLIKSVSLTDVMEGNIPRDFFSDRIVLIGDISENTKDLFLSPFGNQFTGKLKRIGGVQIHASFTSEILSAVLDNRPLLKSFPLWLDSTLILVWGIVGSAAVWRWRSPIRGGAALITSMGSIFGISCLLFFNIGWIFPTIPCLLSLVGSAVVVTTYLAHQERELSRSKEFFNPPIQI